MPKDIDYFLKHMEEGAWEGRESDLLGLIKECLPSMEYLKFESFVKLGYVSSEISIGTSARKACGFWCRALNRPLISVNKGPYHKGEMLLLIGNIPDPSSRQARKLKARGWLTDALVRKFDPPKTFEAEILEALTILKLPFHRGLPAPSPPIKTRYERLMNENIL